MARRGRVRRDAWPADNETYVKAVLEVARFQGGRLAAAAAALDPGRLTATRTVRRWLA